MALELKNYDPAIMQGANIGVSVDLTDLTDANGNEVIEIDGVTDAITFVRVTNAVTGSGPTISAQGETNVALTINSLLTGALTLDSTSTGAVDIGTSSNAKTVTIGNTTGATLVAIKSGTGGTVVTSADDNSLAVGANGATNPVLQVDSSTSSVATGLKVTGAATGTAVALAAIGSAADESLSLNAKAAGTIAIGGTSTGLVSIATASSSAGMRYKRSVLASSGNTTMTSAMSGSVMLLDGAATDYTLPAIGAGDVGMEFWFVATIIATDQTITAGAADLLTGSIEVVDTAADTDVFVPDVSDDLVITLNGTTTGGKTVGSWCHLVAISATRWWVEGIFLTATETQGTPFS